VDIEMIGYFFTAFVVAAAAAAAAADSGVDKAEDVGH